MKLTPAAARRTRTWPSPGSGVGASSRRITSGPPVLRMRMTCIRDLAEQRQWPGCRAVRRLLDLADQVVVVERLLDDARGLVSVLLVHQRAVRADHDDRDVAGRAAALQLAQDLQAR